MPAVFHLAAPIRPFASGRSRIEVSGSPVTVGEALRLLWTIAPGLKDRLTDERGEVRPHVNLFVGDESIRTTGGLATPLPESCEISVLPAVSGGAR